MIGEPGAGLRVMPSQVHQAAGRLGEFGQAGALHPGAVDVESDARSAHGLDRVIHPLAGDERGEHDPGGHGSGSAGIRCSGKIDRHGHDDHVRRRAEHESDVVALAGGEHDHPVELLEGLEGLRPGGAQGCEWAFVALEVGAVHDVHCEHVPSAIGGHEPRAGLAVDDHDRRLSRPQCVEPEAVETPDRAPRLRRSARRIAQHDRSATVDARLVDIASVADEQASVVAEVVDLKHGGAVGGESGARAADDRNLGPDWCERGDVWCGIRHRGGGAQPIPEVHERHPVSQFAGAAKLGPHAVIALELVEGQNLDPGHPRPHEVA